MGLYCFLLERLFVRCFFCFLDPCFLELRLRRRPPTGTPTGALAAGTGAGTGAGAGAGTGAGAGAGAGAFFDSEDGVAPILL